MRIEVAKAPTTTQSTDAMQTLAKLCYYYPQYTLAQARRLPYKYVNLLLKEARIQKAIEWSWLTQIAAAPQTEKGKGVKALLKALKDYSR